MAHLQGIFEDVPSRLQETLAALHGTLFDTVSLLARRLHSWTATATATAKQSVNQSVCSSVWQSVSLSVSQFILQSVSHSLEHVFPSFLRCSAEFPFQCTLIESLTCLCGPYRRVSHWRTHPAPPNSPPPPSTAPTPLQHVVYNFNVHWRRCRRW